MSDYAAVGGVTAVLMWLLRDALNAGPVSVLTSASEITAVSPDLIQAGSTEEPQLNLFMYYVSLNADLRNLNLPSYNASGGRVSNPPLALNLHYLVSAYGSTLPHAQLTAEVMLGWAMKVFHDNPVVPTATIEAALIAQANPANPAANLVSDSTLAQQIEHLRITPETLTTEEIYRLWPAFQAPYRPSSAFQVSVVVIQDTAPVTSALPVRRRRLLALPMQSPVISEISPQMAEGGEVVTITGANFVGQSVSDTMVLFDGVAVPASLVQGGLLTVTVPATLEAGTRLARVERMVTFPDPATPRRGFTSSPVPFQVVPTIQDPSPLLATQVGGLTLTVSPPVGYTQQVTVYIGDTAIPVVPVPSPSPPPPSATVTMSSLAGVQPGTYPIRIEVDGASSLLAHLGGQWSPQVQVT
jgi:hypothetical protein